MLQKEFGMLLATGKCIEFREKNTNTNWLRLGRVFIVDLDNYEYREKPECKPNTMHTLMEKPLECIVKDSLGTVIRITGHNKIKELVLIGNVWYTLGMMYGDGYKWSQTGIDDDWHSPFEINE